MYSTVLYDYYTVGYLYMYNTDSFIYLNTARSVLFTANRYICSTVR